MFRIDHLLLFIKQSKTVNSMYFGRFSGFCECPLQNSPALTSRYLQQAKTRRNVPLPFPPLTHYFAQGPLRLNCPHYDNMLPIWSSSRPRRSWHILMRWYCVRPFLQSSSFAQLLAYRGADWIVRPYIREPLIKFSSVVPPCDPRDPVSMGEKVAE